MPYLQFFSHIKVDFSWILITVFCWYSVLKHTKYTKIKTGGKKIIYFVDVLTLTVINNMKYNVVESSHNTIFIPDFTQW